MRLGILETLHAWGRETLYPSRSLTAGSIRYQSGGLDEAPKCATSSKGGELAFRDRARRLRIG